MAEQSAFLTAFDEMQKKKREQQGFNAPAPMESVVDTVGQAPAVQSPFSQAAAPSPMAAAVDPMAQPDVLAAAPADQAPPSLVANNPFAPSVGVSEPTVSQDAQDATERARIEDRLARTNADIIASGETVGGVEKEAFKPMGGGFSFGGNTPIPADRTDSFIPVVNEILKRTGASEFEDQGKAQVEAPSADPFGVTSSEIVAAGNQNFGRAVSQAQPENPYRTQYGVNSLDRGVIDEIQQQDAAAPQAQLPSTIQNANGQNLAGFKPKYEGQSLTDYMAGRDDPSAASVQVQDPQGRFRRQAAPVAGETPEQSQARTDALFPEQADFREESAAREARQAARPDFGEAQERAAGTVTDRERRAARGDGMSDADRRDIAKANQRGASAGEVARGMKVAKLNNIDLKTGKPLEGVSGKELAETGKIRAETAQILSEIGEKSTELNLTPAEESRDKTAGTALAKWDDSGRATVTSNITALDSITKGLEDGQIKTRGFIDALPFGSDWARAIVNPDAQDAKNRVEGVIFQTLKETLGAQFTEKEGKRLVEASYNPMLGPEANAARLRDYSNGLKKAVAARESQMAYLKKNKTLQGYDGATPEGIMSQVGSGGGGSQIQGDVNYQSDTQSKADQILSAQ